MNTPIQECLLRLAAGDLAAKNTLLQLSRDRLLVITRGMLSRYSGVRRWVESDDVLQNVLIRLDRALNSLEFKTSRDFLSIAATNIRRELIDLARHYFGPEGIGANHATPLARDGSNPVLNLIPQPSSLSEQGSINQWAELHEGIAKLPDEERELFDLHWYHGLTLVETASLLEVSLPTAKRRWVSAKLRLSQLIGRNVSD